MGALLTRRVRTTQPQSNALIDWSNPITQGLVFAYTCSNEAQGWGEDGRNGIPYVKTSDGTPYGRQINTTTGTAGQLLSGSSGYLFGSPTQTSVKSGVYSLFAFGTVASGGALQTAIDDDDGTTRRFQFRINSSKVEFIPFYSGGNGDILAASAMSSYDVLNGFAMGATANGTACAVYQKGVKTAATLPGAALTPNSTISIGARKTGTQQWTGGGLALVAMWNRALTDAEHQSLADNPWQLFKPALRRIWMPAPSASSGVVLLPDVYCMGISSDSPQVVGTANQWITPDVAAQVIASNAPSITQPIGVTPSGANSSLSSAAPSLAQTANQTLSPDGAAVAITTWAPSVTQSIVTNVTPGVGALSASGYAPSITQTANTFLSPGPAALAAAAAAPAIAQGGSQSVQALLAPAALSAGAPGVAQAPMPPDPRYARPIGDVSPGAWVPSSGASLAAMLSEVTPDDSTYITTSAPSVCQVKLAPVVDPGTSSGQVVRYRAGSSTGSGVTVRLKQGVILIAEWVHASLPTAQTTFERALTAAQCDSITDYTDLRFEFEAT